MSKRKKVKAKYLPGAKWQDVLRGKPVTRQDEETLRNGGWKDKAEITKTQHHYLCRDCKRHVKTHNILIDQTCRSCGGFLARVFG